MSVKAIKQSGETSMTTIDLAQTSLRELNQQLHQHNGSNTSSNWEILNPRGEHAIACGMDSPASIEIKGHVGYYCGGMNKHATITVEGNAGTGVAENMMSGLVRIKGNASQSAGATGHGGLLVVEGDAAARCGISLKGLDIVVKGSVGHMSGFMAQKGRIVICGDAGHGLGDSIYEARIYLQGKTTDLGADCVEKEMREEHLQELRELLEQAGIDANPADFKRYGSARKLYNFNIDHVDDY